MSIFVKRFLFFLTRRFSSDIQNVFNLVDCTWKNPLILENSTSLLRTPASSCMRAREEKMKARMHRVKCDNLCCVCFCNLIAFDRAQKCVICSRKFAVRKYVIIRINDQTTKSFSQRCQAPKNAALNRNGIKGERWKISHAHTRNFIWHGFWRVYV